MGNGRKHRDIRFVTTDKRRSYFMSKPNCHITKWFSENLLAIEMNKTKIEINKPVYLDLSILDISKAVMYEFWFDYIKPECQGNAKECYIDTNSFIVYIKIKCVYEDIVSDVEKRFDLSNYKVEKLLPMDNKGFFVNKG